ncbi:MAG: DUF4019 domain-containing protein [Sphingomonadales bacterium]|nr:MAG: DUF4019 domain-containing protein [Sphingomonadales bacterium]
MKLALAALLIAAPAAAQTAPRAVNITQDSAPGWVPTVELEQAVLRATADYFEAIEAGDPARAYPMLTPQHRAQLPLRVFLAQSSSAREAAGALRERRLLQLTWTKDPPRSPAPGIYAVIDIAARHANADRECGYVVWYQRPEGGPFKLMRIENNVIDNVTAEKIIGQKGKEELDRIWKQFSANCPNYTPAP